MSDFRVKTSVVLDDGSDGVFWRHGEAWLRERGKERRLLDLAPELERWRMAKIALWPGSAEHSARDMSMAAPKEEP